MLTTQELISYIFYIRNYLWSKDELNKNPQGHQLFKQSAEKDFVKSYTFKGQKVSILGEWNAAGSMKKNVWCVPSLHYISAMASIRNQENKEKARKRLFVTGDNSVLHN